MTLCPGSVSPPICEKCGPDVNTIWPTTSLFLDKKRADFGQAIVFFLSVLACSLPHTAPESDSFVHCFRCSPDGEGDLSFFAVENSKGFAADPTIRELAAAIEKATDDLPTMKLRVPPGWLKVYDELRRRPSMKPPQQHLPLSEVVSIAAQCGLPHRGLQLEHEVHAMLEFFHSLGAVLWFDAPGLRHVVVLDPQWVIDGVSTIVRNFDIHAMPCDRECARSFEREWSQLTREARLDLALVPRLWQDEQFAPYHDFLLLTMVRFGLAVPLKGRNEVLVPPLLVFTSSTAAPPAPPDGALDFLLHFSAGGAAAGAKPSPLWTASDVQRGFLPLGAFHRLCGAAIGWCFHTSVGFEPSLGKGHAYVVFGRHRLALLHQPGQPAVRVQLFTNGQNGEARAVLDRLRLLLFDALRHFPGLGCVMLLPLPGHEGHYVDRECLLQLEGQTIFVGAGQLTSAEVLDLLRPWVPPSDEARPDVFISYRWGEDDSRRADTLFDALSTKELRVFQDKRWLKDGSRFDMQFMTAMLGATVVTPLLSWDALKRMTALTPSSPCDNVLLEWTLALELHKRLGIKVVPLLIGPMVEAADGTGRVMRDLFAERPPRLRPDGRGNELDVDGVPVPDDRPVLSRVPDVLVKSVCDRVDEFLRSQGHEPCTQHRSAQQVVHQLSLFLGVQMWALQTSHGKGGVLALHEQWGCVERVADQVYKTVVAARSGTQSPEKQTLTSDGFTGKTEQATRPRSASSRQTARGLRPDAQAIVDRSAEELENFLQNAGYSHYLNILLENDIYSLENLCYMQEEDLIQMGFKRGAAIVIRRRLMEHRK